MVVFHGNTFPVEIPKILKSERLLDFGNGFYTTSTPYNTNDAGFARILLHVGEDAGAPMSKVSDSWRESDMELALI